MKRKNRSRLDVIVDLTPLIDVVFLLLIFFMVSTTFIDESKLNILLPEATGAPKQKEDKFIQVVVSDDARITINGDTLPDNTFRTIHTGLQKAAAQALSSTRVVITADANTAHQYVVRVMDAASQLGFLKLSISSKKPSSH